MGSLGPAAVRKRRHGRPWKSVVRHSGHLNAQAIFESIYRDRTWGDSDDPAIFSGWGSTPDRSRDYEDFVVRLIDGNPIDNIVDVGCGDFQVSKRILDRVHKPIRYTGLDIAGELIDFVGKEHGTDDIGFRHVGPNDLYPKADLLILRQVLQHNTNRDIRKILGKAKDAAPFLLVAEHVPKHPKATNLDMPAGPCIRMDFGSGVYVERAPFNLAIDQEHIVDWGEDGCLRIAVSRRSA